MCANSVRSGMLHVSENLHSGGRASKQVTKRAILKKRLSNLSGSRRAILWYGRGFLSFQVYINISLVIYMYN